MNTIPDRFHFTIDRRICPEERLADVRAEIVNVIRRARRGDRGLNARVATLLHVPPGWVDPGEPFCGTVAAACLAVTGRRPKWRMTPGFTDRHWLTRDGGVPTVMYGVRGDGAHADVEYSEIDSMLATANLYAEIAMRMPTPAPPSGRRRTGAG